MSEPAFERRADAPDPCEPEPGQPPPTPLRAEYTGVARAARCQDEVLSIMRDVARSLGVKCAYCHLEPDYAADTRHKQVANWMARELAPRLRRRAPAGAAQVTCRDCHAGRPRLLGDPRRRDVAIEWMTSHLTEEFDTQAGKPPKCKDCHGGDLGSPEFRAKLMLTSLPSSLPLPLEAESPPSAPHAAAPSAGQPAPDAEER